MVLAAAEAAIVTIVVAGALKVGRCLMANGGFKHKIRSIESLMMTVLAQAALEKAESTSCCGRWRKVIEKLQHFNEKESYNLFAIAK